MRPRDHIALDRAIRHGASHPMLRAAGRRGGGGRFGRRGGGKLPALFTPTDLGGKLKVFTPSTAISGSPIDSIANLGGAGGSYSQTLTLRPAVGTLAGVSAADPDGSNDRLEGGPTLGNITSTTAYHVFAALNIDGISRQLAIGTKSPVVQCIICDVGQFWWLGLRDADTTAGTDYRVEMGHFDGGNKCAFSNAGDFALATDILVEARFATNIFIRVGANAERTGDAAAAISGGSASATQMFADASDVHHVNGRVGAVIVCNAALSAAEIANVRAWYQRTYPGIAA